MKALFSRIKNGGRKPDSKDRDSIDSRSFREKAQPPLPVSETDAEPLPATPFGHNDRELPPIAVDNQRLDVFPPSVVPPISAFSTHSDTTGPSIPGSSRPTTDSVSDSQPSRALHEPLAQSDAALSSKKVAFASSSSLPSENAPTQHSGQRSQSNSTEASNPGPIARGPTFKNPVPNQRTVSTPATPRNTSETIRAASGRPGIPTSPEAQSNSSSAHRTPSSDTQRKASSSRTALVHSPTARKPTYAASYIAQQEVQSMRSSSPMSYLSNRTSIQAPASWSEAAEEDLVFNLGARERTRQEVLWEIVASEDRYVIELLKMKETFIDPLLHPFSTAPVTAPSLLDVVEDFYLRPETPYIPPPGGVENLPIASRFLSSNPVFRPNFSSQPQRSPIGNQTPVIPAPDGESSEEDEIGRGYATGKNTVPGTTNSPYASGVGGRVGNNAKNLPFPSRSHVSLPPPPRQNPQASTASLGRQSVIYSADQPYRGGAPPSITPARGDSKSSKKQSTPAEPGASGSGLPPHLLPEDLRECLKVLEHTILSGHLSLNEGLRKRYEEQYPLVRSLADVFISQSHILRGYAKYVLHLERALEQVDNALSTAPLSKKPKKQDIADWIHVSTVLKKLEDDAAAKGETGLAISLSKPFQRLLKYPLLFQNLLFHTDPSTFEYESTLSMVAEIEKIVRSIEDEKIQKEERDNTRDALARIDGLDKNKALVAPKPSRQLLGEKPLSAASSVLTSNSSSPGSKAVAAGTSSSAANGSSKAVQTKTSFRRLSVPFQGGSSSNPTPGGKKDLWLVTFSDVVLRCQRTGTTTLPLVSSTSSRATSLPDMQGKGKHTTVGRRNLNTKPRNLYKFIKIEHWTIGEVAKPKEGAVTMEDITRTRSALGTSKPNQIGEDAEEDETADSSDSDRKSKMSFSYWGADKVTLAIPPGKKPNGIQAKATPTRRGNAPSSYTSTANAKFGSRMRSPEPADPASPTPRPTNKRNTPTPANNPPSNRKTSDNSKPPWGSPAAARTGPSPLPTTGTGGSSRRQQKLSAPTPPKLTAVANKLAPPSPAPSELTQDSGVGFYRDVLAHDPPLNRDSSNMLGDSH